MQYHQTRVSLQESRKYIIVTEDSKHTWLPTTWQLLHAAALEEPLLVKGQGRASNQAANEWQQSI